MRSELICGPEWSLSRPDEYGIVSDFVRDLVEEDCEGGDEADVSAGQEGGADREAVREVVEGVCQQVEVGGRPGLTATAGGKQGGHLTAKIANRG